MGNDADAAADRRSEARLRGAAAEMGLALRKSRTRDPSRMDFDCYRIVQSKDGCPVAGTYPYPCSLSLDGVEEALGQLREGPPERPRRSDGTLVHGRAGAADPKWGR